MELDITWNINKENAVCSVGKQLKCVVSPVGNLINIKLGTNGFGIMKINLSEEELIEHSVCSCFKNILYKDLNIRRESGVLICGPFSFSKESEKHFRCNFQVVEAQIKVDFFDPFMQEKTESFLSSILINCLKPKDKK